MTIIIFGPVTFALSSLLDYILFQRFFVNSILITTTTCLMGLALILIITTAGAQKENLKSLGFYFSIAGILTGFLPAVLDVAGTVMR